MAKLSSPFLLLFVAAGFALYGAGLLVAGHPGALAMRVAGLASLAVVAGLLRSLGAWTLLSIVVGAELGVDAPGAAMHVRVLAEIFLRLVRVIVAPLLFATLTTGIAGHARLRSLGSLAWKTLVYFELVTTLALLVGAAAMHLTHAGAGVVVHASAVAPPAVPTSAAGSLLLNAFPENLALAVAGNQVLQVAVFSVLFGIALALLPEEKKAPLLSVLRSLGETMFQFTRIVMYFAPVASGAAIAYTLASTGLRTLVPLGKLLLTFYSSVAAFALLVLLPIALLARIPLRRFLRAAGEPTAIGFATSTSEAALPLAIENMEAFGVPRAVVAFVIPAGYSFNMDGASLYLAVAALFAVQASGQHLSPSAELAMLATLALASKGLAGVPRAILTILLTTADSFHLPLPALMMILGIDALMDMGRTALNVFGNCLAAGVLGRFERDV